MKTFQWFKGAAVTVLLAGGMLVACQKDKTDDKGSTSGYDRKAMLTNYADNYIIPAYAEEMNAVVAMQTAIKAFAMQPNATTLATAREKWLTAYQSWQKVAMFELGPAEGVSLLQFVNTHPCTPSKIQNNISTSSYNLASIGSGDEQGFAAIDYLINGLASTDQVIIDNYSVMAGAVNRGSYLTALADRLVTLLGGVQQQWNGDYRNTFVNATGTDVSSSTSKLVNSYVLYYERFLRSGKIGLPVGAMTGFSKPELMECYYSPQNSRGMADIGMAAMIKVFKGESFSNTTSGPSMYQYMVTLGNKDNSGTLIADVIVKEMNEAAQAVHGLDADLKLEFMVSRPKVLQAYQQMQEVVPLIKVDMVSAMGISITYVDNDGD
jgi:predicted lipoprotein